MKATLVDYLVCPKCKEPLECEIHKEDSEFSWVEIIEGRLLCPSCGREYPITRGIPRLYIAEDLPDDVLNTVGGFGWEWITFNDQIQDSYMTSETHFLDFIYPVSANYFENKVVLDAGCGMGRFLRLGAEWGSKDIIGVDLSGSVEAAYQNTRMYPNAHVVQADILTLPFSDKFDYIFSVGVLMCVQKPAEAFSKLSRLLKPGGKISVWVYSEENNWWVANVLTPFRKYVTSHLPRKMLYGLCHFLGVILFAIVKLIYKPINEKPFGQPIKRFLPYNEYLFYSSRLNYASLVSVIFDHLVPQIAGYISREELVSWFEKNDLTEMEITPRNNMSWRGHGRRPYKSKPEPMIAVAETSLSQD